VFAILCLSTKRRVIAYHEVSRGTLDSTLVHPREVFKAAILANASAIILAHVHPSGPRAKPR
jgi:DNA repair protein RadC